MVTIDIEEEKKEISQKVKKELEGLRHVITGIVNLHLVINEFPSSNKDLALVSSFDSVEALEAYQIHPEHVRISGYVKTVTCDRACIDYR